MNLTNDECMFHGILVTGFIVILAVTAGCSGIASDPDTQTSTGTEEPSLTPSGENDSSDKSDPVNGTDLRHITIPDNGSITISSELNKGDPSRNDRFYEPAQIGIKSGNRLNVTMHTEGGKPMLRMRSPNGTVVLNTSRGDQKTAQFIHRTFTRTGNYTIETTSINPNTTFEYNLTIERAEDGLFAGPKSTWNKTEKYLAFGRSFVTAANATADKGQFSARVNKRSLWANSEKDYLIIGYRWNPANLTDSERVDLDVTLQLTYANLGETYRNATNNSKYAEGKSWIPEVIYFRAENPQGELYRTNFLTKHWARDYATTGNGDAYDDRYYATNRLAPGNPAYDEVSDNVTTTPAEFPRETYKDFIHGPNLTHAEKYYAATGNESDDS